ncbi:MAG: GGDEF domain-containing protein [Treponema sp.]|nr:GGDEF domain-containing protein [Treponema sp.]
MPRKRLGVVTICPEDNYEQSILSGIFAQANYYNYDVLVFSPLSHPSAQSRAYVKGELNIYSLINFDLLDAVIVTPITMQEQSNTEIINALLERFKRECHVPVVSIDFPFGDYPVVYTDEKEPFVQITDHLIQVHGCKKIAVLNGPEHFSGSKVRLSGVQESMKAHGLNFDMNLHYYGDFWYTSGEQLGEQYVNKKLPLPDAVICTSDYMAIGLTNTLISGGIKVPDQVIVTGYDGVTEVSINNPPITTYKPHTYDTALKAVNLIHQKLEPGSKDYMPDQSQKHHLIFGATCGCEPDEEYIYDKIRQNQYSLQQNFNHREIWEGIGIGTLFESYTNEILAGTSSTEECIVKIYESKYLIKPYQYLYLCLNQNWIDPDNDFEDGYTQQMNMCIFADRKSEASGAHNHVFFGEGRECFFPVSQMMPDIALNLQNDEPQVYYFAPVHFNRTSLGYCILQNNLTEKKIIGVVFRNYMRMINNALEMTRTRNKITSISEHDMMTNLLNRRGMNHAVSVMNARARKGDKWLAIVADMDGLKYLNDNFGHAKGDEGLAFIASSMRSITKEGEVCVRNGGDEFLIAGLGRYNAQEIEERLQSFAKAIEAYNATSPVAFNASIGYCLTDWGDSAAFENAMEQADVNMYIDKRKKKMRM